MNPLAGVHRPTLPHARVRVAAVATCAVFALSGCGGGDVTSVDHHAAASASVPAPPAPPATVAPVADLDHATDFVLAWSQALDYGLATGDADPLRRVTSLGCFTCAQWVIQVQHQGDTHTQRTGGTVRVGSVAVVGTAGEDVRFRASLTQLPGSLTPRGGTTRPVPAGGSTEIVDLVVGITTTGSTGEPRWTMKAITPPGAG